MDMLRMGPDGQLLLQAVLLSALIALLTWRRVSPTRGLLATIAGVLAVVAWQSFALEFSTPGRHYLVASFVMVPTTVLLGASRAAWLARRAWLLLLLGPVAFAGCYVGLCYCAVELMGV